MLNTTVDCIRTWSPRYLSLLTIIIVAVFCLIITLGNFMIITAVVIDPFKKLRTPFNYFVVNLAVADLIIGIVSMPVAIHFHVREYLRKKDDFIFIRNAFSTTLFISLTASPGSQKNISTKKSYKSVPLDLGFIFSFLYSRSNYCLHASILQDMQL